MCGSCACSQTTILLLSGPPSYCLPIMGPSPCNNPAAREVLWRKPFSERVDHWESVQKLQLLSDVDSILQIFKGAGTQAAL